MKSKNQGRGDDPMTRSDKKSRIGFSVLDMILLVLLAVIVKMIFDFKKIKPIAGYLQIPYAIWVTFAGYLNFAIWWLNR